MKTAGRMKLFERYLSIWVLVCMALGLVLGIGLPAAVVRLSAWELVRGSQVNAPIAVLIWLMIYPMMLRVDFAGIKGWRAAPAVWLSRWWSTGWLSRSAWRCSRRCFSRSSSAG